MCCPISLTPIGGNNPSRVQCGGKLSAATPLAHAKGIAALPLPLNVIKQLWQQTQSSVLFIPSSPPPLFPPLFLLSQSKRCRVACIKPSALIRPASLDQTPARFLLTFWRFLLLTWEPDFSQLNPLYQCSADACLPPLRFTSPCSLQHGRDSDSPNSVRWFNLTSPLVNRLRSPRLIQIQLVSSKLYTAMIDIIFSQTCLHILAQISSCGLTRFSILDALARYLAVYLAFTFLITKLLSASIGATQHF